MTSTLIFDSGATTRRRTAANTAAELRAIEDEHNCRWDPTRRVFVVLSSDGSTAYDLTVGAVGDLLVASCACTAGRKGRTPAPGIIGCRHRAALARRLRRMGVASFGDDGLWHVSPRLLAEAVAREES